MPRPSQPVPLAPHPPAPVKGMRVWTGLKWPVRPPEVAPLIAFPEHAHPLLDAVPWACARRRVATRASSYDRSCRTPRVCWA